MKQKLLYICLVIAAFAWNGKVMGQVHLPINPMTQDIFNACKVDTEGSCDWNGGIHLGGNSEGFNYDDRYCVIKFDGIPAVISFDYEAKGYLLNPTSIEWYVQVGTNGNDFIDAWRVSLVLEILVFLAGLVLLVTLTLLPVSSGNPRIPDCHTTRT